MRQELREWQGEAGSRLWLSALIAAMEDVTRADIRREKLDRATLEQFRAHLALPASCPQHTASKLRH
jgi:hypothetical protein